MPMDEMTYCAFCGRVIRGDFRFCPFCGVQSKDFPVTATEECVESSGTVDSGSCTALHRLEEMESTLTNMENELDHFLASKNG